MHVVLSSHNSGKIREFQQLFKHTEINLHPLSEFKAIAPGAETAETFVENALDKARQIATSVSLPVIADDSGLCVTALQGAPGIFSARYVKQGDDAANREKLLNNLKNVAPENRQAYFYCVIVFLRYAKDPTPIVASASWHGYIAEQQQGEHGFGYDSLFYLPEYQCTAAELKPEIKNQISHRAKAFKKLIELLRENKII